MRDERVMVFIDGSNFYHALKANNLLGLDLKILVDKAIGKRKLIRVYYYNAPLKQSKKKDEQAKYEAQQKFFAQLRSFPYWEVKLGYLLKRKGGYIEKGVDVYLAIDLVRGALKNLYDTAILISGDADFTEAVRIAKEQGKHVELVYPNCKQLSFQLRDICDKIVFVETLLNHQ